MDIQFEQDALIDIKRLIKKHGGASPKATSRILGRMRDTLTKLSQQGWLPDSLSAGQGYKLIIPNTPFICIYRGIEGGVQILRVLHGARQWP